MKDEESGLDRLTKLGERVRKAFESKPEEKPVSKSTQAAVDKAVGPRFQDTRKKGGDTMKDKEMKHENEDMEESKMHKVHVSKQMKKHDRKMKGKGPKKY